MKHAVIKSLATGAILSLAIAACSSSGTTSGTTSSATGKPLVVDDTPLSPMTDTFSPYSATSTGGPGGVTAEGLYNEPLFIWNILNPSQAPFDLLGTGYSWSNGGGVGQDVVVSSPPTNWMRQIERASKERRTFSWGKRFARWEAS